MLIDYDSIPMYWHVHSNDGTVLIASNTHTGATFNGTPEDFRLLFNELAVKDLKVKIDDPLDNEVLVFVNGVATNKPAPVSLPPGGTTNQILSKKTNGDFDVQWSSGGSAQDTSFAPTESIFATNVQEAIESLSIPVNVGLSLSSTNGVIDININGIDVFYTINADVVSFNVIKPTPPNISRSVYYFVQGANPGYSVADFPSNWTWVNGFPIQIPLAREDIYRLIFEVDPEGNIYVTAGRLPI